VLFRSVRNVADTIDDQLAALSHQSYPGPWELVVADNGCTDATRERVDAWRTRLPNVTVVDASKRRGVAHARNIGLRAASGEVLLICDGDDIVAPDWLQYMVGAMEDHPIVTGFMDLVTMNRPTQYEWTGDATMRAVPTGYGFLPYAPGGNIGMWREVFDALVAFDERLRRAEDIDFGWRAGYLGIPIHFEPRAVLHRRLRSTPRSEFRAAVRGGIAEPGLYRRHRDRGMPRAELQECVQQYRWLLRTVPDVIGGRQDPYQWAHHAGKRAGRVIGSARNRVIYL
jgi:glycosyltransferase involved in cell wall biosynthesis